MKFIKKILNFFLLSFFELVGSKINNKIVLIKKEDIQFKFYTPNKLILYRANTFFTKEPETINWINNFSENSTPSTSLSASSRYLVKAKNCQVYAFEPSVFNLETLSKNIFINKLNNLITILPFPLTDEMKVASFNMTSTVKGAAISTFSETYTYTGSKIKTAFSYKTLGIKIDDITKIFKLPTPDYIKIDVDGIEHLILSGGEEVLKKTKEILIEINDEFNQDDIIYNAKFIKEIKDGNGTIKFSNVNFKYGKENIYEYTRYWRSRFFRFAFSRLSRES